VRALLARGPLIATFHRGVGNDLPTINDDPAQVLPMLARYIGTDGMIAYAKVNPDYTRRPDPSDLLPVLDRERRSLQRREPHARVPGARGRGTHR